MAHTFKTRLNPAGFLEIFCEEGHFITTWNDGDEILDFTSFTIAYTSPDADLSVYHCIDAEENERLTALKKEAEEIDRITE